MIEEIILLIQYLPKITIFYVLFCLFYGITINNWVVAIALILDLIDWIELG